MVDYKIDIVEISTGYNMIIGTTHFIKSIEDIYEAIVSSVPEARFGLAFIEASGDCLIRFEGTDDELTKKAVDIAKRISAGHTFVVLMNNMYPINILPILKSIPEVVNIFCATQNPVQLIIAETDQGRGILGIIDGEKTRGIEDEDKRKERRKFLRDIGYKF
ncbi:adenosine-specific kinase [Candidatus Micrarchaeota archaeon]|nr:adenosine-specific kinase [Candidatus Micrarchaeota archaeon]